MYSPLTLHDSTFGFRAGGGKWTSGVEVSVFEDEVEEDALADELDLELASLSFPSFSPPSPTLYPVPGLHHDWMVGLNLAWLARMLRGDRRGMQGGWSRGALPAPGC